MATKESGGISPHSLLFLHLPARRIARGKQGLSTKAVRTIPAMQP